MQGLNFLPDLICHNAYVSIILNEIHSPAELTVDSKLRDEHIAPSLGRRFKALADNIRESIYSPAVIEISKGSYRVGIKISVLVDHVRLNTKGMPIADLHLVLIALCMMISDTMRHFEEIEIVHLFC